MKKLGYGFKVRVYGDYACFTRPEMKAERVSYDVMTPSSARGILEAIYWKPAITWVIDKIHVLNEINFTTIRRNEVSENIKKSNVYKAMKGEGTIEVAATEMRQQRSTLALKDVNYVIEAHFRLTNRATAEDTEEKHYNIMLRRLRKGQCFHTPCFGTREFSAKFEIIEDDISIQRSKLIGEMDLGYMLYDMDYKMIENNNNKKESTYSVVVDPMYFKAKLFDGVLDLTDIKVVK